MELLNNWINGVNDILWSYILIIMLLGCAVWFTIKSRFVQFRMIGEMIRLLGDSAGKGEKGEKHISSFQAFAVSLASRVGTGNLAGVATAVAIGGPGSVFWMWLIALLGSSSAFVESTLAQLYKEKGKDSFIGGPAYYMATWFGVTMDGGIICRIDFDNLLALPLIPYKAIRSAQLGKALLASIMLGSERFLRYLR